MNVGMMACYDQAKEVVASLLNDPMTDGPTLPTRLGASATAGFTAALFSLPFDLVKSRLMAQKVDPINPGDLAVADTNDPTYTESELNEFKSTVCANAAMAHMNLKNWGFVRDQSKKVRKRRRKG